MILNYMKFAYELFGYLIKFVWLLFYPKADLATRLLAVQSQLAMCKNRIDLKKDPKPRFTPAFRILWVVLSKLLDGWEELAQLMQPATVKNGIRPSSSFIGDGNPERGWAGLRFPKRCET